MDLSEILGPDTWDPAWPQTLYELSERDPEELPEVARRLRRQAMDMVRRDGIVRVSTFADVVDLQAAGKVFHPWSGKWRSYAVDADRHPILEPATTRRRRWAVVNTALAPTGDDLPPLPGAKYGQRPGWLLLYGGDADVLTKKGVVARLAATARRRNVLDVVGVGGAHVWSVRNGVLADGAGTMTPWEPDGSWDALREALNA